MRTYRESFVLYLMLLVTMVILAQFPAKTAMGSAGEAPGGHAAPSQITFSAETESTEPAEVAPAERMEQIKALKEEFAKELDLAEKVLKNAAANEREAPVLQLAVDLLQRTDLVYSQQITALNGKIEIDRLKNEREENLRYCGRAAPVKRDPTHSFCSMACVTN